jgi:hypothetical protein
MKDADGKEIPECKYCNSFFPTYKKLNNHYILCKSDKLKPPNIKFIPSSEWSMRERELIRCTHSSNTHIYIKVKQGEYDRLCSKHVSSPHYEKSIEFKTKKLGLLKPSNACLIL